MNATEILIAVIGVITTISSGWVSWFFTRKKYNSEVDSNYINNLQAALKTYDVIIASNKEQIEDLVVKNEKLREEVEELRKQVLSLTMNICMDLTCTKRTREINEKDS